MIDTSQISVSSEVRSYFLNVLETFSSDKKKRIMVNHFGEFSRDLIHSISSVVEEQMIHTGDKKKVVKRVFSVLIEGLQNIHLHGERDDNGKQLAFLFLVKNSADYRITIGNIIQQEDVSLIENYVSKINSMNTVQLKDLYTSILTNGFGSKKEGVGLGFLTMRMKSENKLNYQMLSLPENNVFFSIEVIIPRS